MPAPFGLSPSALARYFFHDCERFLRFRSTGDPEANGVPRRRQDSGLVMETVIASGQTWEEKVISQYLDGRVRIAPGNDTLAARRWTIDESIQQLRQARPGEFLYQLTLRAPRSLYAALGLQPDHIEIRDNRPDLVEVRSDEDGERQFRVIDIKRGASLRLPYRMQVLFYALELDHIIREQGIDGSVDLRSGAAWLGEAPGPEDFDLTVVRPHLEDLIARLPDLFNQPLHELDWHVCYRCEWCEYLDHCRAEMETTADVSRLVGLTAHGKRFLARELSVRTLPELTAALQEPGVDASLEHCASLTGERPRLEARLASYARQSVQSFNSLHPTLPRGENIAVFLTAQTEPVADRTWLFGMLIQARANLRHELFQEESKSKPFVVVARTLNDCAHVQERFVQRLYQVLLRVDVWNRRQADWKDKLSLQLYCYSEQERATLIRVLMDALYDPRLAELAMVLLFHIQAPDLLQVDDHPREILPYPVVPLVSAIGRLLALPVDVAYTLPETLAALGSDFAYPRRDRFHFPFGHGLRSDEILRVWDGEDVDMQRVLQEAAQRLYAYRAVLQSLRNHASHQLVAWPPKHELVGSAGMRHPRLSRLAFLARYESVLSCLAVREARCESRERMAAKGDLVPMVHTGGGRFRIEVPGVVVEASNYTRWLIVRDTSDGLRAQARFNDWAHRGRSWGGQRDADIGVGWLAEVEEDQLGFARAVCVQWDRQHQPALEQGAHTLLMPRFMDFNTKKVLAGLARQDAHPGLFVTLLDHPDTVIEHINLPPVVADALATEQQSFGLTPSQVAAWQTVVASRVTTVWGPPGTGKTHFLASLLLAMAEAYRRAGQGFRVLVTAMTHAAIENVMRKLTTRARELNWGVPSLAKVGSWRGEDRCGAEDIGQNELDDWLAKQEVAVVGSTAWGLAQSEKPFDLVLIDEASQMKVPEAALAIERMRQSGRLVAAGDHKQLGPILTGVYPDPPAGEPVLHGSVFDLLRERPGRQGAPLCQLLENWRMNDVLTGASRIIYGPDYICASDAVAARRLRLSQRRSGFVAACLDPEWPLVIAILSGIQAARVNDIEATLVAEITCALRDDLVHITDDEQFWRERLFIVSPHHTQIRAIRRALTHKRAWQHRPFVETVDKMQGQEADAVLISYGVADPEYAANEAEFIYGRNRLNVAITRARLKSIVFLPKPLLDATPEVLDSPVVAEGLAYMRGLVQLARSHGDTASFSISESVSLEVVRLGVEVLGRA